MTWQYIAGFFDGEGSLTHNKKGYRITISQTDKSVLQEIKYFSYCGKIFKNKKRKPHWKDSWVFYIAKQEDILHFLLKIYPFLITKKSLVKMVIPDLRIQTNLIKDKKDKVENLKKEIVMLRNQGSTYREIGEKLNIDFGHARRLYLNHGGSSSTG